MNYEDFVSKVKEMGCKELWRETTEYDNLGELKQLYALVDKQLIGSYSNAVGGVIFKKPSRAWRTTGRTFEKIKI
jgi:hypothetical protein